MKKKMSEEDIKLQFITPAIEKAGWTKENISMEYTFTDGQMFVDGRKVRRGQVKRADYLFTEINFQIKAILKDKDS